MTDRFQDDPPELTLYGMVLDSVSGLPFDALGGLMVAPLALVNVVVQSHYRPQDPALRIGGGSLAVAADGGVVGVARALWKNRFSNFFTGYRSLVLGVSLQQNIYLWTSEAITRFLDVSPAFAIDSFMVCAAAAAVTGVVTAPLDTLYTRAVVSELRGTPDPAADEDAVVIDYTRPISALSALLRRDGPRELFRRSEGIAVAYWLRAVSETVQPVVFQRLLGTKVPAAQYTWLYMVATELIAYPIETAGRRQQIEGGVRPPQRPSRRRAADPVAEEINTMRAQNEAQNTPHYAPMRPRIRVRPEPYSGGLLGTLATIVREEGIGALYNGFTVQALVSIEVLVAITDVIGAAITGRSAPAPVVVPTVPLLPSANKA